MENPDNSIDVQIHQSTDTPDTQKVFYLKVKDRQAFI